MDFDKLQNGSGNVSLSEYKYVYDESEQKIYKVNTIRTSGKKGEIHSVICADCKREMMQAEEYYCPYCNA